MKTPARLALVSLLAALAACSTPSTSVTQSAAPTQAALDQLQQVRDAYGAGKYGEVIRTVATSNELAAAPPVVLTEALKLQAFSYCVSNYQKLCEDDFTRILAIDPSFELTPAEQGHPKWGPAYRGAKASYTAAR
ncbi:TssQ family T6SS-associated lipoprotein [Bordetella sp. N]|uniref:TssQ family T6SS-associated lipoprotein n=1 Tax=Bordetella sp. N TaxID=1746199 RepID=UPI00070B22E8|nr:TssQ family T6SS-associated lipoprotein [Bordetella sp. N]ALM85927.1 hypothetical protein ASB57_25930 [Bordetella sp. N]